MRFKNLTSILPSCTFIFLFLPASFISCNSGNGKPVENKELASRPASKMFSFEEPTTDAFIPATDSLYVKVKSRKSILADSITLYVDGVLSYTHTLGSNDFTVKGIFKKVGRQNIRVKVFYSDSLTQSMSRRIIVLADTEPVQLKFEVVRKLPHNVKDYTQGLFYYDGFLYEGTGKPKQSRLIKTNPLKGEVLLEHKLDDQFFGEGITRVDDKIYQLTYKHKVGFIYDLNTFHLIRDFDLQTMEGWGLAYDGENLIVSEGSSYLYFYDPEYLGLVRQLDVANNRGLVNNLNELEFAEGKIWANVYTKNIIVQIDPATGQVIAELNLESLYPKNTPKDYDHVLNGIAFNPDTQTYYVTGKYWPDIYEIKISR